MTTKKLVSLVVLSLVLASLNFGSNHVEAITYVMVQDHHLQDQAELVVIGTCISSVSGVGTRDQPRILYTFKVEEVLKGSTDSNSVQVTVDGGMHPTKGYGFQYHGYPTFQQEDRVMLLLVPSSEAGIYEIIHIFMGAFYDVEGFALRNIDNTEFTGQARDFQMFKEWMASSSLKRQATSGSYYRTKDESLTFGAWRQKNNKRFTLISGGTTTSGANPAPRWFEFDSNTTVTWDTLGGSTYRESFDEVLQSFRSVEGITISFQLGGTTTTTGGLNDPDGRNTLAWDDPENEITGSFDCLTGGVVAVGGPKYSTTLQSFRSLQWNDAVEGDVVVQNGVRQCDFRRSDIMEVLGHELGHVMGLGHSCGDDGSGPCNTVVKDEALMRAQAHFDIRGPVLNSDDVNGLEYLYCQNVGLNCITDTGAGFTFTDLPNPTGESAAVSLIPSLVLLLSLLFVSMKF